MTLAKTQQSQSISPFLTPKSEQEQHPADTPKTYPENNKARMFRRLGNVCEIASGACLNSAVIFTFHLLQVHPIGLLLAVGTSHFYFTATTMSEGKDKVATNLMSGASASLAILCALSEPIGEWWEASQSKSIAQSELTSTYKPNSGKDVQWVEWGGAGLAVVVVVILISLGNKPKRRR